MILKSLITNESFDARYFGIVNYYEYLYVYGRMAVYLLVRTVEWEVGSLKGGRLLYL